MKIAIDAMGGDNGPAVIIEGALSACQELNTEIILVGDEQVVQSVLSGKKYDKNRIEIVHASDNVEMHDSPLTVRTRRESSIWIGTELVKQGKARAVISAGNTGAAMATGLLQLGRLKGIDRPAITSILPTETGKTVILDLGANSDCKPIHLAQFAIMGYEYGKLVHNTKNPSVGLLSIGEEASKGNEVTREANRLLKQLPVNFYGNIEGKDIFAGAVDVVVCDGFTGNVVLKVGEGLFDTFGKTLKEEITASFLGRIGSLFLRQSFARFKDRFDYTEYGGAPLIGLNGISVICHGRSPAKAIKNAIKMTQLYAEQRINDHIQEDIEQNMFMFKQQMIDERG